MKIKQQNAINILLVILSIVILLHILIIIKIIPYQIAWGGRLQNDEQMYMFETISIIINLFLIFILIMKGRYIQYKFKEKTLNIVLWIFFILFILNTIGNLFAQTNFEKLFSIFTLTLAIMIWVIARSKVSAT
jgi:membrane protease YdiL (CAAX protease family)